MTDSISRFDSATLMGALQRDAIALDNVAKTTKDTSHNLAAEATIAGRPRETFQDIYYSYMGGEASGILENDVRYHIRGAGAPVDSQVKTHLSLLGNASFFPVMDSSGKTFFTRVGTFDYTATNQMQNHFGMKLLYAAATDGKLQDGTPTLTVLDTSTMTSDSTQSSGITFRCGLSGEVGTCITRPVTVYDSLGTPRTLNYVFTRNADWADSGNSGKSWSLTIQAPSGSTVNGYYSAGNPSNSVAATPVTIRFDANGYPLSFNGGDTPPNLNISCPDGGSISTSMNLGTTGKADGVMCITGGQSRLSVEADGQTSGVFRSLTTAENGNIYASFSNGKIELVGRLVVGVFNNPDGLEMLGQGLYLPSKFSGKPTFAYVGGPVTGSVAVGALESSTVETIPQMAKMIERQQQFNNIITSYSSKKHMLEKVNSLRKD